MQILLKKSRYGHEKSLLNLSRLDLHVSKGVLMCTHDIVMPGHFHPGLAGQ